MLNVNIGVYRSTNEKNPLAVVAWEATGEKAVCLRCKSESEMIALENSAIAAGLPAYSVIDAGRTEISSGTRTVLAVGPANSSLINTITGHLQLY